MNIDFKNIDFSNIDRLTKLLKILYVYGEKSFKYSKTLERTKILNEDGEIKAVDEDSNIIVSIDDVNCISVCLFLPATGEQIDLLEYNSINKMINYLKEDYDDNIDNDENINFIKEMDKNLFMYANEVYKFFEEIK